MLTLGAKMGWGTLEGEGYHLRKLVNGVGLEIEDVDRNAEML